MIDAAPVPLSLLAALAFAVVHVLGGRLTFLEVRPRSIWLSVAGGVSVAYVFVHVLPELADRQRAFTSDGASGAGEGPLIALERHVYLIALAGLAAFYGLERLARCSSAREAQAGRPRRPARPVFWLHLGSFAAYNVLIGYLLVHREEADPRGLAIYASALALHFVVNDQALRELHGELYSARGRWVLAAAPLAGWAVGVSTKVGPMAIAALFAFLAGGIVLNVLKEELPEERESRFSAFTMGAATYALLLLATK